ncbi:hypothetical protein MBLNU457_4359t1 [Dothideomycetes sp. NU457]
MGTRSFAQTAPTGATMALDAFIFGFAGHSLVTPHTALKQLWWTDDKINRKVTRRFVVSQLRGEERGYLDKPLAFGQGLTDDTYMEWILERAKRLFLILSEVGVPDRILGVVDDSWQDEDLPIARHDVDKLELSADNDQYINQRFYELQFVYLLRPLQRGDHLDYGLNEHIPMEWTFKLPPAACLQHWDRVHLPLLPDEVLVRRKFDISSDHDDCQRRLEFLKDVERANVYKHEHIAPVWASYTSEDSGYILSDFVAEHTLRTFMDHRTPTQWLRLEVSDRYVLLLEWMHCLADAVASLHHRRTHHGAIRPSNILIDKSNRIAFADVGHLRTFQTNKKPNKNERAEYSAPEALQERAPKVKVVVSSCGLDGKWFPLTPPRSPESSFSGTSPLSPTFSDISQTSSPLSFTNFSRRTASLPAVSAPSLDLSPISALPSPPMTPTAFMAPPHPFPSFDNPFSKFSPRSLRDLPHSTPQTADIFSLGCIYLDILTFMLKGKLTEYLRFRAASRPRHSPPSSPSSSHAPVQENFFFTDATRVDVWMDSLRAESFKHDEMLFRGMFELLKLVRRMLSQNPEARPSALEVRDGIQGILLGECGVRDLCCLDRRWESEYEDREGNIALRESICVAKGEMRGHWGGVVGVDGDGGVGGSGTRIVRTKSTPDVASMRSFKSFRTFRMPWKKKSPGLKVG